MVASDLDVEGILETKPERLAQIVELCEAAGCLGNAPHGLLLALEGANSQGLREMGILPDFGPAWGDLAAIEGPPSRGAAGGVHEAWGGSSTAKGKTYRQMLSGDVKALLLVAESHLEKKPDFLVVVDIVKTAATEQADVVLPAASYLEQVMTMTSMDGNLQLCRQALPSRGQSLPDWQILTRLAKALGQTWETDSPSKIFAEIGRLNPLYKGSTYGQFQSSSEVHWSYPQQGRIGTPRPDLSGIPVHSADAPPWMTAVATGSRVEHVARSLHGGKPPDVPGQQDPRGVAARLSLLRVISDVPDGGGPPSRGAAGGVTEGRGQTSHGPQPPGPSPAERYHHVGTLHRTPPQPPTLPSKPVHEEGMATEAGIQ